MLSEHSGRDDGAAGEGEEDVNALVEVNIALEIENKNQKQLLQNINETKWPPHILWFLQPKLPLTTDAQQT